MAQFRGGLLFKRSSLVRQCLGLNAVTFQQCRTAALPGNRDYRKSKIDFSHQKRAPTSSCISVILLKDHPEYGPAYRNLSVRRRMARYLVLSLGAVYATPGNVAKYKELAPKRAQMAGEWSNEWFLDNFKIPALVPYEEPFAFYASDIQAALRDIDMHLPIDQIYLERPMTTYGEHRLPVMVPERRGDGFEQVTMIATVMREADARVVYRTRLGVDAVDLEDNEDFELVGDIITQYKTLRNTRSRVKLQIEDAKVERLNEMRIKRGLEPLPLPSEEAAAAAAAPTRRPGSGASPTESDDAAAENSSLVATKSSS